MRLSASYPPAASNLSMAACNLFAAFCVPAITPDRLRHVGNALVSIVTPAASNLSLAACKAAVCLQLLRYLQSFLIQYELPQVQRVVFIGLKPVCDCLQPVSMPAVMSCMARHGQCACQCYTPSNVRFHFWLLAGCLQTSAHLCLHTFARYFILRHSVS